MFDKINLQEISKITGTQFNDSTNSHCRLLNWIAKQFQNEEIIVITSQNHNSALAVSSSSNHITNFQIHNKKEELNQNNIQVISEQKWTDEIRQKYQNLLLKSALIIFDIDVLNGHIQYEFYCYLCSKKYNGLLLVSQIWKQKEMRDHFWYKINCSKKLDLTQYGGHINGTGIIECEPNRFQYKIGKPVETAWTFVTSYFDLTNCFDTYEKFEDQKPENYLKNTNATLSLPVPFVIYCEQKHVELLKAKRPEYLHEFTEWRIVSFEDLELVKEYRMKVIENRIKNPYQFDSRNTASEYVHIMVKYWALQQEIQINKFKSTHFGWVHICIESFGFQNLSHFDDVFQTKRNKFSCCYISYQPKELVESYPEYYKFGRCSMCSSLITANRENMNVFCQKILDVFVEILNEGYGHADEQLYSILFFREPELFDFYIGDYQEIVSNYQYVYQNSYKPIRMLLKQSFQHKNIQVASRACVILLESIQKKTCSVETNDLREMLKIFIEIASISRNKSYFKQITDFLIHDAPSDLTSIY